MPPAAQVQAFARSLQHLTALYGRYAGQESAAHASLGKQDLAALSLLRLHGPRRMGDLAADLAVVQSAVTALVDRLEAQGLARRRRSDEDRRAWLIELTDAGGEAAARHAENMERFAAALLGLLTPDERATLLHLFARLEATAG